MVRISSYAAMAKRYGGGAGGGGRRGVVKTKPVLMVVFSTLLGLYFGLWTQESTFPCVFQDNAPYDKGEQIPELSRLINKDNFDISQGESMTRTAIKQNGNLVLVGVMTAKKYLNTRIVSSYHTWATTVPGRVIYFSSEGSEKLAPAGIPVVALKGVDDAYPPQKKSFLMIKYMYEHYGDQYQWFIRADDDIYIKSDKLAMFLHSINSSNSMYIGQAGLGNKDEFGMLNLDKKENYCMGGPSMVFSRATLRKMVPHVSYCLKNMYTTHEDVEVGRCVQKMAEVSCSWAYEMQHLFFHNHREPNGSFTHYLKIKETERALTLHPVKNHIYQYRLHNHFQSVESQRLRHQKILLQRQINQMDELLQDRDAFYSPDRLGLQPGLLKYVPKSREEVISWEYIGKSMYSHRTVNPKPGIATPQKASLDDIIRQVMHIINHNARQRGRTIDFKEILYGYKRVDPLHGADYVLDLLLIYRKHKGRKMTIPVRRHAYLQQTFSEIEFREDICSENKSQELRVSNSVLESKVPTTSKSPSLLGVLQNKIGRMSFYNKAEADQHHGLEHGSAGKNKNNSIMCIEDKVLHFILPLSGRYDTFLTFMEIFEGAVLKTEKMVVLSVMLFENEGADTGAETTEYLVTLQMKYPQHRLQSVPLTGPFSRGLGLEQGSLLFGPDALLIFIDVDMYIHPESLKRIKWNTIQGKQIYFPIVFSQFDPALHCNSSCQKRNHPFYYDDVTGYWRQFGFGIAAMYNSDFQKVGGFDKNIQGWGFEDVKLFETYIKKNYTLFRGAEPGLVHIFHPIHCDSSLESSQYQSCLGTKSQTFGSVQALSQMIYRNTEILNRNEVISRQDVQNQPSNNNNKPMDGNPGLYLKVANVKKDQDNLPRS